MANLLIQEAKPVAEQLREVMYEDYGKALSTSEARKFLLDELRLRLRDHPNWFRDFQTLRWLLKGLFE